MSVLPSTRIYEGTRIPHPVPTILEVDPEKHRLEDILRVNFGPEPPVHARRPPTRRRPRRRDRRGHPRVIGYLHTGFEKNMEHKSWWKSVTYAPRIDYVSFHANELLYVLAIEKLLGIEVPRRATWARMDGRANRIHSHLVWLGTSALELGRSRCSGTASTTATRSSTSSRWRAERGCTPATSRSAASPRTCPGFTSEARKFCESMPKSVDEYEAILDRNAIWLERTKGVGLLSADDALALAQSGPCCSTGVDWDLRRHALSRLRRGRLRRPGLRRRRRLRPLPRAHGRDARVGAHRPPVPRPPRRNGRRAVDRRRPQGGPPAARTSSTPRWSRSSTTSRSSPRDSGCPRRGLSRSSRRVASGCYLVSDGAAAVAREVPRAELRRVAGDRDDRAGLLIADLIAAAGSRPVMGDADR